MDVAILLQWRHFECHIYPMTFLCFKMFLFFCFKVFGSFVVAPLDWWPDTWWPRALSGRGLFLAHPRLPPYKHHSGAPASPRWCELSCPGKHRKLMPFSLHFQLHGDIIFVILASWSPTLAHLPLPYDWPVWHHVTKHRTAISGVRSRRREHFQNAHRHACWCQPLWHPSLFCEESKGFNNMGTWISFNELVICGYESVCLQKMILLDGLAHVQAHFHAVFSMIWQRLWEPRHAIITVAQNFNSHTFVFLHDKGKRQGQLSDYYHRHIEWNLLHILFLFGCCKKAINTKHGVITFAIWSNLPNSSFSMCTSSPGEQSLASRVNPTMSAYSILKLEIHWYVGYVGPGVFSCYACIIKRKWTEIKPAWHSCVFGRRGCGNCLCSPSGQSLDP